MIATAHLPGPRPILNLVLLSLLIKVFSAVLDELDQERPSRQRRWQVHHGAAAADLLRGFTRARVPLPACFHAWPLHRIPTLAAGECQVWQAYIGTPKFALTCGPSRVAHPFARGAAPLAPESQPRRQSRVAAHRMSSLLQGEAQAARAMRNAHVLLASCRRAKDYRARPAGIPWAGGVDNRTGGCWYLCSDRSRGRVGMATKPSSKAPAKAKSAPARVTRMPRPLPANGTNDSNRLLREAAWSAMFGRVESKNPFTR